MINADPGSRGAGRIALQVDDVVVDVKFDLRNMLAAVAMAWEKDPMGDLLTTISRQVTDLPLAAGSYPVATGYEPSPCVWAAMTQAGVVHLMGRGATNYQPPGQPRWGRFNPYGPGPDNQPRSLPHLPNSPVRIKF